MSLKINESAQKKKKSLRDLFGGNLTETGKADLEKAAAGAARDLAAVIFSEENGATKNIPVETEVTSPSYNEHLEFWARANQGHVKTVIPVHEMNHYFGYRNDSYQVELKLYYNNLADKLVELTSHESFLKAKDTPESIESIYAIQKAIWKLRRPDGEEFTGVLPHKLRDDSNRILPRTISRRQAHKAK
ncbi:hypothetical protein ACJPR0_004224 [Cronobacter sakazakii]|nr:hypothetical protein [Cronobacter dublinensis]